jgi:putative ABC transport system permease protein
VIGLILSLTGIYGVISYNVAQRTQEMGLRLALGAQRWNILALIVRQGTLLMLLGLILGSVASLWITRLLTSLLYGVSAIDPITIGAVALLMMSTALVACLVPARRATKVDPLVALRYE